MGARGKKSAADLAVVSNVQQIPRPPPPRELTDEQGDEWRAITDSLPADWVKREAVGALVQLCRLRVRARRIAQLLDAAERSSDLDVKEYRDLQRTEVEITRALMACEKTLRLNPQSTYDKSKKRPNQIQNPWDDDED